MSRKMVFLGLLVLMPIVFALGCAHYPYPLKEFKDADLAIKEAEKLPPSKKDPMEIKGAKAEVKKAYEIYIVCRTEEAKKHLIKAKELADRRIKAMVNKPPLALISGPSMAKVNEVVYFSGEESSDPEKEALMYDWTFGDGATSQGATASHSWAKPGDYTIILKVTDKGGLSDTDSAMLKVTALPAPVKKFITLGNTVLFDFDKSVIKPAAKDILDDIANTLKKEPEYKILLEGHTCWIGTDRYNMGLSKKRAYAVYKYLVDKGIDKKRFTVKWYGERKPAADNRTKEGRKRNRRTVITLTK